MNNNNLNNNSNNLMGPGNTIPGSVINNNPNNSFESSPPAPTDYSKMYINNLNPVNLNPQVNQINQNEDFTNYKKPSVYTRLIILLFLCLIIIGGIIYLVILLKD